MNAISKAEANVSAHIQELQERLPLILQQIEDVKATQLDTAPDHVAADREDVRVDYDYNLRHFLDSTASILSELTLDTTPSMQVSSFEASNSAVTSKHQTAATHTVDVDLQELPTTGYMEILIHNLDNIIIMVLQVEPDDTIKVIEKFLCYSIKVPNTKLYYSGKKLTNSAMSLKDYGIQHNSSIFIPLAVQDITHPIRWFVPTHMNKFILMSNKNWNISFEPGDRISDLKKLY